MTTTHKDYGCHCTISDKRDGRARLVIRMYTGEKVHDKVHANRRAAYSAWRRFCN